MARLETLRRKSPDWVDVDRRGEWGEWLLDGCPPAYSPTPKPGAAHNLAGYQTMAGLLGTSLMPHQAWFVRLFTEKLDDGATPAWRHAGLSHGRQGGKTFLLLEAMLETCVKTEMALVVYAAQDGQKSRQRLREDFWPLIERAGGGMLVKTLDITFNKTTCTIRIGATGSRIEPWTGTEEAGHGDSTDLVVSDEFFDHDNAVEGALLPTLRTTGQWLKASTAGTDADAYFVRHQAAGREAASSPDQGRALRVLWVEWSAKDGTTRRVALRDRLWQPTRPWLGWSETEDKALSDSGAMSEHEWLRAYCNMVVPAYAHLAIDPDLWKAASRTGQGATPRNGVVLGVGIRDQTRDRAVIAACDAAGRAELVEELAIIPGGDRQPDTLAARLAQIAGRNPDVVGVAVAPYHNLKDPLEALGVPVRVVKMAAGCSALTDGLAAGALAIHKDARLEDAVRAAARKDHPNGEYTWSSGKDLSALWALTLAVGGAFSKAATPVWGVLMSGTSDRRVIAETRGGSKLETVWLPGTGWGATKLVRLDDDVVADNRAARAAAWSTPAGAAQRQSLLDEIALAEAGRLEYRVYKDDPEKGRIDGAQVGLFRVFEGQAPGGEDEEHPPAGMLARDADGWDADRPLGSPDPGANRRSGDPDPLGSPDPGEGPVSLAGSYDEPPPLPNPPPGTRLTSSSGDRAGGGIAGPWTAEDLASRRPLPNPHPGSSPRSAGQQATPGTGDSRGPMPGSGLWGGVFDDERGDGRYPGRANDPTFIAAWETAAQPPPAESLWEGVFG